MENQSIDVTNENTEYEQEELEALYNLEILLESGQFELVSDKPENGKIRLIYIMNDAVESFIVFDNARLTGIYDSKFEGSVTASLTGNEKEYVMVVHQNESVFSIFFQKMYMENHLYNYGKIGHFWVKGYEYLRNIEYKIAIVRDKREYLGEEYCNNQELKLAHLSDFPPLNYCCYPSVPQKYIVPKDDPWTPSNEAIQVMYDMAELTRDRKMQRMLKFYKNHPEKCVAKIIASMLHRNSHKELVDYLVNIFVKASENYPVRNFGKENEKLEKYIKKAEQLKEELSKDGIEASVITEEPFVEVKDSIEFKVYLMIWKKGVLNRKVELRRIV